MGAIGQYIHLTAAGYNKTGINTQRQSPSIDAITALQNQREEIQKKIDNYQKINNLKPLEKQINNLIKKLGVSQSNPLESRKWEKEAQQFLLNEMNKEFSNLQHIDFSTLNVDARSALEKGVGKLKTNYWVYKKAKTEILNRINELNSYLENFTKNISKEDYKIATKKIDNIINKTYKDIYKTISSSGKEPLSKQRTQEMIKNLNEIILEYAAMPAINLQKGTLFEKVIQLIPEQGKDLAKKATREAFISHSRGKKQVKVEIEESFFKNKSWKMDMGDIIQTGKTSQGKIDVAFEWEGQDINISAKNINLENSPKFIHTTTGSSLLYMLQDENSDFVNHYFNLYSKHVGREHLTYANQKKEYLNVLKLTLAYKGLTGESYGREDNKANVFIINDSKGISGNSVRVLSVADLLKKISESDSRFLGLTSDTGSITKLYSNKKVENSPSGIARVNAVLAEAHSRKISTSFNSSLIKW